MKNHQEPSRSERLFCIKCKKYTMHFKSQTQGLTHWKCMVCEHRNSIKGDLNG